MSATPPMFPVIDVARPARQEFGWYRSADTLTRADRLRREATERARLRTLRQRRKPKGGKARG